MLTSHRTATLRLLNRCLSSNRVYYTELHLVAYRLSSIVLAVPGVSAVIFEDPVGTPVAVAVGAAAAAAAAAGRILSGQHLGQELHSKVILGEVRYEVCSSTCLASPSPVTIVSDHFCAAIDIARRAKLK